MKTRYFFFTVRSLKFIFYKFGRLIRLFCFTTTPNIFWLNSIFMKHFIRKKWKTYSLKVVIKRLWYFRNVWGNNHYIVGLNSSVFNKSLTGKMHEYEQCSCVFHLKNFKICLNLILVFLCILYFRLPLLFSCCVHNTHMASWISKHNGIFRRKRADVIMSLLPSETGWIQYRLLEEQMEKHCFRQLRLEKTT